jgi:molecular chaperone DnaJ
MYKLAVDLKFFYTGTIKKLRVNRTVTCDDCDGSGSKVAGAVTTCTGCRGRGMRMYVVVERIHSSSFP